MACLEALARRAGIATRVRAFMVLGRFWYSRFRLLRTLIPKTLLLLRPRFFLENTWVDFDELYAPMAQLAQTASAWGAAPRQARLLGMC